ncbi:hypothetical protein A7D23_05535 [Dehalobacter sp. TeCB1]|nr:hypothetical protein A7D23_05535 [Dehalobacter sp. TeCB1]
MAKIKLQRVHYMPKELEQGVLYVSEEFRAAAHLCACGCGAKIRTPLGPTEWSFSETPDGPTLYPSIGNWQQPCQSHYFIRNGQVVWAPKWMPGQIEAGRAAEELRRNAYYDSLYKNKGILRRIWDWIKSLFS